MHKHIVVNLPVKDLAGHVWQLSWMDRAAPGPAMLPPQA